MVLAGGRGCLPRLGAKGSVLPRESPVGRQWSGSVRVDPLAPPIPNFTKTEKGSKGLGGAVGSIKAFRGR